MRCPSCHCKIKYAGPVEPITHQKKIRRLMSRREKLRYMWNYMSKARYLLQKHHPEKATYRGSFEFDLLVGVESLHDYLRTELNRDLAQEGLEPLRMRAGALCENRDEEVDC